MRGAGKGKVRVDTHHGRDFRQHYLVGEELHKQLDLHPRNPTC